MASVSISIEGTVEDREDIAEVARRKGMTTAALVRSAIDAFYAEELVKARNARKRREQRSRKPRRLE